MSTAALMWGERQQSQVENELSSKKADLWRMWSTRGSLLHCTKGALSALFGERKDRVS